MSIRLFRVAAILGIAASLAFGRAAAQDATGASAAPAPVAPAAPAVSMPSITNAPAATPAAPAQAQPSTQQPTAAKPATTVPETVEQNDFQEFIAQTLGQRLPLYGYNLFQRAPSTFAPVENIPVTPDYVVGPGDELVIRAWGQIDVDYRATVDRNGMINIPQVGPVPVTGVQYKDLTEHVKTAVSRNFRNFQLMVTMGQLRSVQILVVGQAARPGAYTVSSLSTLVNAIFAAGGPSTRGSMRAIQLKRGDKVVTEFDMYDLLVRGDKSKDASILPGDVIYFPPVGPLAAIAGGVKNPAIYELKGPTAVATLLDYASGLTTTAQTRRASIERIDERRTRSVDQFDLDIGGLARTIKDGDLVSVFSISPRFDNAVTLRGNVAAPLRYPFREGMRIRDLIPEKEALITPDYYQRRNLSVRADAVRQGTLSATVRQLGDEINWDYAVIERQNPADLTSTLIPFNLGKAILEGDPANDLPLKAGDIVTVFSKTDVAAPAERRAVVVQLEGEFNFAGVYQAQKGETLRQLVSRVGGLTKNAYLFGAEFIRESTRRVQEERLKRALDQLERDIQQAAITSSQSAVTAEDANSLKAQADAQKALLSRLRGLKPTGRIVLDLPERAKPADLPDIALEDGDRLIVPSTPSMVSVFGAVFNESAFLYTPAKGVDDYIDQAGGLRREADSGSIYVLRADGSVLGSRGRGLLPGSVRGAGIMPGDAVVVPEDLDRTTFTKQLKDWTQILYQFGLGAAAVTVLRDRRR